MNLTALLEMLICLEQSVGVENSIELRRRVIDVQECVLQIHRAVASSSQALPPREEKMFGCSGLLRSKNSAASGWQYGVTQITGKNQGVVEDLNQCSHMTEPSPFSADSGLIEALSERAVPVLCPEDRVLFRQGEECLGVFILRSGHATLEMLSNTGEVVARFATGDGSLLGLPAVFSGEKYSLTAIALRSSNVRFVESGSFLDLMGSNPALSLKVLQVTAAETRAARAALVDALARQQLHKRSGNGADIRRISQSKLPTRQKPVP